MSHLLLVYQVLSVFIEIWLVYRLSSANPQFLKSWTTPTPPPPNEVGSINRNLDHCKKKNLNSESSQNAL